ncbi:MAG: radical SAM protein [Verrucomicrobiae bacterium]|nr:radical SAM protein [Verrucomicrobiae bacterium]
MNQLLPAHREHPRQFEDFRFVYPVLSRRSGGISIGINANPDRTCNFNCLYCQVNRLGAPPPVPFDLATAEKELRTMRKLAQSGALARHPMFREAPPALKRVRDVAISGDGEPTLLPNFAEIVEMVARVKSPAWKLVLLTNAAGLHRPEVKRALTILDAHNGEVWAKLDAGTEAYFKLIGRSSVPFQRILKNLKDCARHRPIVIQSLFIKLYGQGPSADEIAAYCERLREIVAAGGHIKLVQVSTIARQPRATIHGQPAWQLITALSDIELDAIRACIEHRTKLPTKSYYGAWRSAQSTKARCT